MQIKSKAFEEQENPKTPVMIFKRILKWRWTSIVLLGLISNLLINIIFDYKYQRPLVSFSLAEYINAIIAAFILLEGTRLVTRKLDNLIPWSIGVTKRLFTQLGVHLLFVVMLLNTLLISITYVVFGDFYAFDDLLVINIAEVSLVFFFSIIDTGIDFFNNWKRVDKKAGSLKRVQPVQLSSGRSHHLVKQEDIKYAICQFKLVLIITNDERKMPYTQSLDNLMATLDSVCFFRANRQTILHQSSVQSITPLDYGKLSVSLVPGNQSSDPVVISRTKAAEFRRWLKSNHMD